MNDMLAKILTAKREEVTTARQMRSEAELLREAQARQDVRGFAQAIEDKIASGKPAIVAEIKKPTLHARALSETSKPLPSTTLGTGKSSSPSETFNPAALAAAYAVHGATCLSVWTDVQFFQGSHDHLRQARAACLLPVLRKDFMIDPYQIIFSRALGADCVVLLVEALPLNQLTELESCALELGMDVLVEIHHAAQLNTALQLRTPLLGINNFDTPFPDINPCRDNACQANLQNTLDLLAQIPANRRVLTENGILHPHDIDRMRQAGVEAFLVGEALLFAPEPGLELARLIT